MSSLGHWAPLQCHNGVLPSCFTENIFWGGDFKTVVDVINDGRLNENDIRFFLGYSGWDANQLENELNSNSWILTKNIGDMLLKIFQ